MSSLFTTSRTIIKREWASLEPKLATGLATGAAGGVITDFASQLNIHLSADWQKVIVLACVLIGGYVKHTTFPTPEQWGQLATDTATAIQPPAHPITAPVKVVPVDTPTPAATPAASPSFTGLVSGNTPATPASDPNAATQILPPTPTTAAAFLANLPSAQSPAAPSVDGH